MTSNEPTKKARLADQKNTTSTECRMKLKPIVPVEFTEDIPLHDAYVGILINKKDIAIAIKQISTFLPGFGHLKRCSNNRLLLSFKKEKSQLIKNLEPSFETEDELKQFLTDKKFNLNLFENNFVIVPVCRTAPRSSAQAQKAAKSWPVSFHPDIELESILNGTFFTPDQQDVIRACMQVCIEATKKEDIDNEICSGGVVILNPNDHGTSKILAISTARVNEHPMWHGSMLAIDLIAAMRGKGAWNLVPSENPLKNIDNKKRKPESNLPLCYPSTLSTINIPKFEYPADVKSKSKTDDAREDCKYLCTKYWVFLDQEPCAMCAMALLHSRVGMVFYNAANKTHGVLGSKTSLHTLPGLNHRYKVWSSALERDSSETIINLPLKCKQ
ncbi:probable inactive tRNA-specific adenosine deaminase-like protein 3 [Microplitis mediator]|uniref:probable inactive tRNA-specific adenosine deaminase-like protein 3 n=1 Tax=Microplitis mediator TaxID=375433 RepID=UPI002554AD0D|nr:probable inactive tRNA-specific adenosine deaminase-like protein 3 [Microplitis mediator]XP_057328203.1 probable inactive tRNA-specific adenosine deaminase-like protein 3 [Microplitis mediator]XP_057328204.1 probable inactive tRNA-specific adenosine deaminase-like protein 3 [Microplitis mediator]